MHSSRQFILLLVALVFGATCPGVAAPPTRGWTLAWSDEFDGAALDTSKWSYFTGVNGNATNTTDAVSVGSGILTIKTYTSGGVNYTGWLGTYGSGQFQEAFGYFEARIRFNDSAGEWSAFWLQSPTINTTGNDPADNGAEVDIVEHRKVDSSGNDVTNKDAINIHWDGYGASEQSVGTTITNSGTSLQGNWHTYGVMWTPTAYYFFIDGVLVWVDSSGVSQRTELIYLSTFVNGSSWAGSIPSGGYGDAASSTTKMDVDYVRFYRMNEWVENGNFEAKYAPWYAVNESSLSTTGGLNGSQGARVNPSTTAGAAAKQNVYGLLPNTDYILTGWGNVGSRSWPDIRIGIENHGNPQTYQSISSNGFTQAILPFTTGSSASTGTVFGWVPTQFGDCYLDEVQLRRAASVTNAGLEQAELNVWTSYGSTDTSTASPHAGGAAIKYTAGSSAAGAEQVIYGLTPNTTYRLSAWTNMGAGGSPLRIGAKNYGGADTSVAGATTGGYTQSSVNFTTGANNTSATIYAWRASSSTDGYADDFFLSEPLASPWTSQDVSAVALPGIAGKRGSRIVAQASGADIWGTNDRFHFIYQSLTGNGHVTARVRSLEYSNDFAKAGVMMRETLNSYVRHMTIIWRPDQTIEQSRRTTGSGATTADFVPAVPVPPWLRVERRGDVFTAFYSSDGTNWTRLGAAQTLSGMPATIYAGLPVCSHDETTYTEAAFDNATVGAALEPGVSIPAAANGAITMHGLATNLRVTATITDDGTQGAVNVGWALISGPGTPVFANPNAADTTVRFPVAGTYTLRCTATNNVGSQHEDITVNVVDTSALSVWLKMNETSGTTAADASGNGVNATTVGSPAWTSGLLQNALSLSGTNQYATLPAGTFSTTGSCTIACWVKPNVVSMWSRIFDFGSNTTSYMFLTPLSGGGAVRFAITTNGNGTEQQINGTAALTAGAWTHVAVTISGGVGILYVNGVEVGRNSSMTLLPSSLGNTTANYLGKSQYPDPYLNGLIDDFRVYRRALSAGEITGLASSTGLAPLVSAGTAPSATSAVAASLTGTAGDQLGGALTVAWSKISGPGTVTFGNAASAATSVTFSQSGAYVLRLTAANSVAEVSNDLTVNVSANQNVFADWIGTVYPGNSNANVIGFTADPDGDGICNGMEFALGLDPTKKDAATWTAGKAGLPLQSWSNVGGVDYLSLQVRRPVGRTGIAYTAEVSGDLNAWSAAVQTGAPASNGDGTETVVFRDTVPKTQGIARFIRLRVTQQ